MTDPVKLPAARTAVEKAPVVTGGAIAALVPHDIDSAFRLAQALAQAGDMIPEAFRGSPQKIMAAVIKGMEVGLAPMQALASITVINGRPTIWGDAIPALVQRAGHHLDVEMMGDGENRYAKATLTRSDGRAYVRTFGVHDAKLAKLWGKPGPWQSYPDRMMAARARSYAARDGAADALMGLGITDGDEAPAPERARDVTPRRGGVVYREPIPVETPAAEIISPETGEVFPAEDVDMERIAAEAKAATDRLALGDD